jgi:hypothetical protein
MNGCWFAPDSPVEEAGFGLVWGFSLSSVAGSLFGAGKAVLRPVACDQVRGARGRGQGTETLIAWRLAAAESAAPLRDYAAIGVTEICVIFYSPDAAGALRQMQSSRATSSRP